MNSDSRETAELCAKDAEAIISCPSCGGFDVSADDDDAERSAYARATKAWEDGVGGFRGMTRDEVMDCMKSVLRDALIRCPSCGAQDGD